MCVMGNELRSFGQVLQSLEDGQLVDDLSIAIRDLNAKLQRQAEAQGKAKGELVLKIKLQADAGGTVQVDGEIVTKEPKPARARSVMWLTKDGNLSADNPRQTKLPLREIKAPEARDVGAAGAPEQRSV